MKQRLALYVGQASSRLPGPIKKPLWRTIHFAQSQPVYRLVGRDLAGAPVTVIAAGREVLHFFPRIFFSAAPEEKLVTTKSLAQLPRYMRQNRDRVDFAIARVDGLAARAIFSRTYVRVPDWVRTYARVPADLRELEARSGSLHQDLRLVRKHRFGVEESHDERDLARFYETMYRSHTAARHGSTPYVKTLDELRIMLRRGALLWITHEDRYVAGAMVERQKDRLVYAALGTLQGDATLLKKGVLSACYLRVFEFAQRHGIAKIDFGGARPAVNDNLLRYKRKWGATLDPKPAGTHEFLLYWKNTTPGVVAFLNQHPLISRERDGFSALHADPTKPFDLELMPGLHHSSTVSPGYSSAIRVRDVRIAPSFDESHT